MYGQNIRFRTPVVPQTGNRQSFLNNPYPSRNIVPSLPVSSGNVRLPSNTNNSLPVLRNSSNLIASIEKSNNSVPIPSSNLVPMYPMLRVPFRVPPPIVSNAVPVTQSIRNHAVPVIPQMINNSVPVTPYMINSAVPITSHLNKNALPVTQPTINSAVSTVSVTQHMINSVLPVHRHMINSPVPVSQHMINTPVPVSQHMISPVPVSQHMINTPVPVSQHMINSAVPVGQHMINSPVPVSQHMINSAVPVGQHMIYSSAPGTQHTINSVIPMIPHMVKNTIPVTQHLINNPEPITSHLSNIAVPVASHVMNNIVPFGENVLHSVESGKELKLLEFLKKFLIMKKKEKFNLTIPDFRSALKTGFLISNELRQRKHNLNNLLQSREETWNSEMKKISELRDQLSEICSFVISAMNSGSISKKLKMIKKKREQKKKTKLNVLCAKMKAEQAREKLNQEIDKWLDDLKEKNLKLKREAEMKKEADYILLEVRRKIHEAKRTIEKIKVLEKLRNARHANAVKKGLHILPDHNKTFDKKDFLLKDLMSKQLVDYEAEEKALKVMLETEQEGQLEEEAQWKLKKLKTLQQKKQKQISKCLFGSIDDPSPSDPLYFFYKYHTSANDSIENLAQIRHHWDVYLSKDGESVPHQWVVPATDCDASWKQCLS